MTPPGRHPDESRLVDKAAVKRVSINNIREVEKTLPSLSPQDQELAIRHLCELITGTTLIDENRASNGRIVECFN